MRGESRHHVVCNPAHVTSLPQPNHAPRCPESVSTLSRERVHAQLPRSAPQQNRNSNVNAGVYSEQPAARLVIGGVFVYPVYGAKANRDWLKRDR